MDQRESYGYESKFTGGWLLPENIVIVGLDCEESEFPELADPDRIHIAVDDLVPSIAAHGVREPIEICKRPGDEEGRVFCVKGRRRVRAARIVNHKLDDDSKIKLKCIPAKKGSDLLLSLTIENEFRVNDTPLARARKADRMRQRGDTDTQIARAFGVTVSAVKSWWALLEAPRAAQKAVEDGSQP